METWDLAHGLRHVAVRAGAVFLKHEDIVGGAGLLDFDHEGGGDLGAGPVGDERHALVRFQLQADVDGVVRADLKGRVEGGGQRVRMRHE